jgi:hypothetical protein
LVAFLQARRGAMLARAAPRSASDEQAIFKSRHACAHSAEADFIRTLLHALHFCTCKNEYLFV